MRAAAILLSLYLAAGAATQPRVLVEAHPGCDPADLTVAGDYLYFTADDGVTGREVWALDGEGMVAQQSDNPPGPDPYKPTNLAAIGDNVVFLKDERKFPELPARINLHLTRQGQSSALTLTQYQENSTIGKLVTLGDLIYFVHTTPATGRELWVSSTVPSTARPYSNILDGPADGMFGDATVFAWGERVVFGGFLSEKGYRTVLWQALDPTRPPELVQWEGKPVTVDYLMGVRTSPDQCVMRAVEALWLWDADATAPRPVPLASDPAQALGQLALTRKGVFFANRTTEYGLELWFSDGTPAGTLMVRDIRPGGASSEPYNLEPLNDGVCFVAVDDEYGTELWFSDGTEAGTRRLTDLLPGPRNSAPYSLRQFEGHLYFSGEHDTYGQELWRTDGTPEGTVLVADINPGSGSSEPYHMTLFKDAIYFSATDGVNGFQIWRMRGGDNVVEPVTQIRSHTALVRSSTPRELTAFGDRVYFSADTPGHGRELCVSDGTTQGTRIVADLSAGPAGSDPRDLQVVDGVLYFFAGPEDNTKPWRIQAPGGEIEPCDVYPAPPESLPGAEEAGVQYVPFSAVKIGKKYYFAGYTQELGVEPWIYEPDSGAVALLKDVLAGPASSAPEDFHADAGRVYFRANTVTQGTELYWTTGEPGHVELGADFSFAESSSIPEGSGAYANSLSALVRRPLPPKAFVGQAPSDGYTLQSHPAPGHHSPDWLSPYIVPNEAVVMGNNAFLVADTPANGCELWVLDKNVVGQAIVIDLYHNESIRPEQP